MSTKHASEHPIPTWLRAGMAPGAEFVYECHPARGVDCHDHTHLLDLEGEQLPACRTCRSPWTSPDEHECGPQWCAVTELPDGVRLPEVDHGRTFPTAEQAWGKVQADLEARFAASFVRILVGTYWPDEDPDIRGTRRYVPRSGARRITPFSLSPFVRIPPTS